MFLYPDDDITYLSSSRALDVKTHKPRDLLFAIMQKWEDKFDPIIKGRQHLDSPFRENTTDYYDGVKFRLRPWEEFDDETTHFWNLIWGDVAISWYKRANRSPAISRVPSDQELRLMEKEIFEEIDAIKIEDVISGKYPGLKELATRLEKNTPVPAPPTLEALKKGNEKLQRNSSFGSHIGTVPVIGAESKEAQSAERNWNTIKADLAAATTTGFPPNLFGKSKG